MFRQCLLNGLPYVGEKVRRYHYKIYMYLFPSVFQETPGSGSV